MADLTAMELAQTLDQSIAGYQRYFGRERTIDKLLHAAEARIKADSLIGGMIVTRLERVQQLQRTEFAADSKATQGELRAVEAELQSMLSEIGERIHGYARAAE